MKQNIQNKYNYYMTKMEADFSKPEHKFLKEATLGIIKSKSVILRQIAQQLQEDISLKKTSKRLRNHLQKDNMWEDITKNHNKEVRHKINRNDYAILDITDIQKEYAEEMEGLDKVRDGDKDEIGIGYWLLDVIRVDKSGKEITPLYNKVISHEEGTYSENTEILSAYEIIDNHIEKDLVKVIDRGGDRYRLIDPFIRNDDKFVIRLNLGTQNERNLCYKGESKSVADISKQVDRNVLLVDEKQENDEEDEINYYKGGATRVRFFNRDTGRPYGKDLWLVSIKKLDGGYSCFLLNIDKNDPEKVIRECFQAYGYRWKIEEYHRHMKNSYKLEDIQLMDFNRIQTMSALLMIAMYFIYTEMGRMSRYILRKGPLNFEEGLDQLKEKGKFIYYRLSSQVAKILSFVTVESLGYNKEKRRSNKQLKLGFAF